MICPRPDKQRFTSRHATRAVGYRLRRSDPTVRAYPCRCGWWHVGRPQGEQRIPKTQRRVAS